MNLVEQHTEGSIKQAIRVTEKTLQSKKIENVAGFFVEALRGQYVDAQTVKKQADSELKAKVTEIKRVEEATSQKNTQEKKAQYEREIGILKQLIKENPSFVTQLIEKVRYSMSGSYYHSEKSFEENMAHPLLNAAILNAAKDLLPERF